MITVRDIVEYILKNRSGMAFKNWTADQLAVDIAKAIDERLLSVVTNDAGKIVGVVRGKYYDDKTKTIFIDNIVTSSGMMKKAVSTALLLYPEVKFFAGRRIKNGQIKYYTYPICKFLT